MEPRHSKLGIASFLLSIAAGMGQVGLIAIAILLSNRGHAGHDAAQLGRVLLVLSLFAITGSNLTAMGLGIAGLVQSDCRKLFAILGTVFATLGIMLTILLIALMARG